VSRPAFSSPVTRSACVASVLLALATAWALAGPPSAAQAAEGHIVFQRGGPVGDIWRIEGNGSRPQQLVERASFGTLSPGGRRLLYLDPRRGFMLGDGRGRSPRRARNLGSGSYRDPVWAPDGKRLAFTDPMRSGGSRLLVMGANGRGRRTLMQEAFTISAPAWAPNGRSIAVSLGRSEDDESLDVWIAKSDSARVRNFTNTSPPLRRVACPPVEENTCGSDRNGIKFRDECDPQGATERDPIWTPVGIVVTRIVCTPAGSRPCPRQPEVSCRVDPGLAPPTLTLLDANGQPARDLVTLPSLVCGGSLSPNRRKIAVVYRQALYVISLAGGPARRITSAACGTPSWGR
jgi:hypothetical protein